MSINLLLEQARENVAESARTDREVHLNVAVELYSRVIKIAPERDDAYDGRGEALVKQDKFEEAIADFTKALELRPNTASYTNRGYVLAQLERLDKAIEDLTKAIELDPTSSIAYLNRGVAYNLSGNFQTAVPDINKAIELNEKTLIARAHLGDTMRGLGNNEEAENIYQHVLGSFKKKPIKKRGSLDYFAVIRSQRGLLSMGITVKTDYEKQALDKRILTQTEIDNMKKYV